MEETTAAQQLTPVQAAHEVGVAVETLRYWERAGLLAPVGRDGSGRRRYVRDDLELLHVIRCLRVTGMPIRGVRRFVDLLQHSEASLPERIAVLEEHRAQVVSALDAQQAALGVIEKKIAVQYEALEARR